MGKRVIKSRLRVLFALAGLLFFAGAAGAQDYPTRPITIVVPFPPGALSDIAARTIQQPLKELLGQPIVVENRPGAGGSIGSAFVARAKPDGHTLLLVVNTVFTAAPTLTAKPLFDPLRDFVHISKLLTTPMVLLANPRMPFRTIPELIDYARNHPGELHYATSGIGSGHHIAGESLKYAAGIDIVAVHYKGGGPAMTDLLGGHIEMAVAVLPVIMPYMNSDKLSVLAVLDRKRSPLLPDVPTLSETVPDVEMTSWASLAAPAGTPDNIVARLNQAVKDALSSADVRQNLLKQGLIVETNTPAAMLNEIKDETARWAKVIEKAGIPKE